MWLVPYRFVQRVSGDVDYRIMATFVQFYTTLLGFVNFRLYSSIGLVYPPKFDTRSDENGAELAAFTLEGKKIGALEKAIEANGHEDKEVSREIQEKVDSVIKTTALDQEPEEQAIEIQEENEDAIDKFEPAAPEADTLPQPELSGDEAGSVFAPFTFFISREAPRGPLEFILRAFGCKRIGWDPVLGDGAFTTDESDPRITHQIVDRPPLPESSLPSVPDSKQEGAVEKIRPGMRVPGRTYVQPQWVWDCVNEGKLLRPDLYAPGATLPPHLSPWVKPTKGSYDPRASLAEQEEEGEAEMAEEEEEEDEEESDEEMEEAPKDKKQSSKPAEKSEDEDEDDDESVDGGMDVQLADSDEDESESDEEEEDEFGGFEEEAASESEDEEESARTQHQKELEAEAAGLPYTASNGADKGKKQSSQSKKFAAKKRKEEEELERQKMMMSRKKRKLLDKMLYSNKKKDEEAQKLRSKRRKIEKAASKA